MIDFVKLIKSFKHALSGIRYALLLDQNIRIHLIASFVVILLSLFFEVSQFEIGVLVVMIVLVLTTEMINTAIEKMVDLITKEHRQEAKIAKDISSGMVLVSAVGAVVVGLYIFIPHMIWYFFAK